MRFLSTGTSRAFVLLALILGVTSGLWASAYLDKSDEAQINGVAALSGSDLANTVLIACKGTGADADVLRETGLCDDAADTEDEVQNATELIEGAQGRQGDTGSQGPVGPRGPGATVTQILAAISTYCAANDDCEGPAGSNGSDGKAGADGADSTIAGPPGPAGKDGADGKDSDVPGPAGPTGPAGSTGDDGRGIQSANCGDDGRWVVTYTDGASEDAGQCRATLLP